MVDPAIRQRLAHEIPNLTLADFTGGFLTMPVPRSSPVFRPEEHQ